MPFDHVVALITAICAIISLAFVGIQLRDANRQREQARIQRESDSMVKIYDINRQLLSLGFDHPKLLAVLSDTMDTDPLLTRYYLQLWLNQYEQVHYHIQRSVFRGEQRTSLERDLSDFMAMRNAQHHWRLFGQFYPASFQHFVNGILKTLEPPAKTAQAPPGHDYVAKT